jgi:outer membrane immunogenic protein
MRRFFLALIAAMSLSATAFASGPTYRGAYNWSGFYVGAQVGHLWGDYDFNVTGVNQTKFDVDGGLWGGHAGYNWQSGPWVYGIEVDLNGASADGNDGGFGGSLDTGKIDMTGSVRGRLGYAWNNWLWYATGGWATARVEHTRNAILESQDKWHNGWTIGTGVSVGLTKNWVAGVEYRFTDYEDKTYTWTASVPTITNPDTQEVTFRLSYKW